MEEMEKEKKKLEEASQDLQDQYKVANSELEVTIQSLKEVETEREKLALQQRRLANTLHVCVRAYTHLTLCSYDTCDHLSATSL